MPTAEHPAAPADVVDRLYGGDLDEFVAARADAARALRAEKRRDEAAAVAALRKPTVAAAAVNRVVRAEPKLLGALLDAGERLRDVQLHAGSAADLREAVRDESRALDALVKAAARAAGGEATLAKVRETLHAAALDPELAADVRAGALVKEAQAVGFPLGVSVPPERARPRAGGAAAPKRAERRAAEEEEPPVDAAAARRVAKAEAEAAEAHEALEAAAADLAQAREELAAAERALRKAQAREQSAGRVHDAATARAEKAAARLAEVSG
jgi:hypothetical protein